MMTPGIVQPSSLIHLLAAKYPILFPQGSCNNFPAFRQMQKNRGIIYSPALYIEPGQLFNQFKSP